MASPAPEMDPAGGFRDDWRWSRGFTFVVVGVSMAIAAWHSLFGPQTEAINGRVREWLQLAMAGAGLYIGRAGWDAYSRRQSVVAYETTKLQITAQRRSDLDGAAG